MKFKDLTIGCKFDFISSKSDYNSYYNRCTKISPRKYESDDGYIHIIGTINCEIFHTKKGWGSQEIPKNKWINPDKKYVCGGKQVIDLKINLLNDNKKEVSYPVKGSIFKTKTTLEYQIWSLQGESIIGGINPDRDLILKKE
ncbi:MAG: hypothetical protein DRJ10_01215 [Bacteroidetes bacterium]|nr:MAG: hypothetical protein DRJ10_01215 [Bacteroidota bacterium]